MDFQVGRSVLPSVCCECLTELATGSGDRVLLYPAVEMVVPVCKNCASRRKRRTWLGALLGLLLVVAIILPVLYILKVDEIIFWLAIGGLTLIFPMIGATVAGNLDYPYRVKCVDGSRGVVMLWFRYASYRKLAMAGETVGA